MAIYGKSTPKAENEAITFDGSQVSPLNQIDNSFNRQFTTGQTHFFPGYPISIKRDQPEIVDLSSDIYNRPSY